ncbi:hypothetical protein V5799_027623 [Amblyomma americanum]|uniref:Uncharacterized protein n=1 Tax=Amblyomma americanum TaxID=6943 RepID=A0AAQ4DF69_AMBAM
MRKLDEIEQRTSLLSERSERLRQLRENFSELIRERYLSPEEMSYRYDYNQPSKAGEYSPPEYIPDPILFGLSTPPWVPRGGPILPSRSETPEHWKPPPSPKTHPSSKVPPAHRAPSPHPVSKERRGSPDRRPRYPSGETSQPWHNHFAKNSSSLLEPSVYWLPDSSEFYRTTSALDRQPSRAVVTDAEDAEPPAATSATPHQQPHQQPSRMSQFSDYIPSNESPPAARRRVAPSAMAPDLGGVFINHTTDVLLSEAAATGKKQQQQREEAKKAVADSDTSGDSFHQGDTDEGRNEPRPIPTLRLRRASRSHGGAASRPSKEARGDAGPPLKKQGSFKQSRKEGGREPTPASRGAPPPAPRNATTRHPAGTAEPKSNSTSKAKEAHEERSARRARYQAETAGHGQPDRSEAKLYDASERSEAGKDSEWSVSCGDQQFSDGKQDTSKEDQQDVGQRQDGQRGQDSMLQLPADKRNPSRDSRSGADRLMRSGSEGQLLEQDTTEHRNERRSVPAELVESRHLAGHSQQMALPDGEKCADKREAAHQSMPAQQAAGTSEKPRSKSHKQSRNLSSSSSSSSSKSSTSDSPKEAQGGKDKSRSHDNSEDSFFDKDILPQETTAYQFLLGNVKPTAPEKPSAVEHPSESSTDIENEMAAAVMTNQSKFKKSAEGHEESKPGSNDSSPPEYDVTSVNIQNIISAKVKHDVPSLISRKVLGLDMYSEPKILQSQKCDDEDSFFD